MVSDRNITVARLEKDEFEATLKAVRKMRFIPHGTLIIVVLRHKRTVHGVRLDEPSDCRDMRDPREVEDVYRSYGHEHEEPNREDALLDSDDNTADSKDKSSKSPVFQAGRHDKKMPRKSMRPTQKPWFSHLGKPVRTVRKSGCTAPSRTGKVWRVQLIAIWT